MYSDSISSYGGGGPWYPSSVTTGNFATVRCSDDYWFTSIYTIEQACPCDYNQAGVNLPAMGYILLR